MKELDINSMDSHVVSLSKSFTQVPPVAAPAMLDCVLAATGLSPISLFSSLLAAFPNLTSEIVKDCNELEPYQCNYIVSFFSGLCHLLKKFEANRDALESFIWKCFIPLIKLVHAYDRGILNQTADSFFGVVSETDSWGIVEATLVPFFLKSMSFNDLVIDDSNCKVIDSEKDKDYMVALSGSFPLSVSCHILTLILDSTMRSPQEEAGPTSEPATLANGHCREKVSGKFFCDLCNMTLQLLSQSLEHRSCAISFLLPMIFKSFVSSHSSEVSGHGWSHELSRDLFFSEIWKCCKTLFGLGPLERKDAYSVLSLYFSFFSCTDRVEEFDIRAEKEFWEEIKRGLVDKEGLVRKQSLHILKTALNITDGNPDTSVHRSEATSSVTHSMTKKEMWADKEAKSLGVGKLTNSVDNCSNSRQRWETFILLYEILEEYGTHLVEAAWNHQITLLLNLSFPEDNSGNPRSGGHQIQMNSLGEMFKWTGVLWERGFSHDNPQIRCLLMQSFLAIEWKNFGNCAKLVPESFVLGPLIEGVNDPVHHKEFGVKGVYSSKTIEGAAKFLNHYTSYLNLREGIEFLSNFASLTKHRSFGRAGLMGLAECIAAAACGVNSYCEVESIATLETPLSDKTYFLDVLRFVIECSKRHFNPKYRLRVCEKVLEAAASTVNAFDVPLEIILYFISALPREFTDNGGFLRVKVQEWLLKSTEKSLLKSLCDFPESFTSPNIGDVITFDDGDLDAWECEGKRWARVLFLVIKEENQIESILTFIRHHGTNICRKNNGLEWIPVKFLILILSVINELRIIQERSSDCSLNIGRKSGLSLYETVDLLNSADVSVITEKFVGYFLIILEELVTFADSCCCVFWSSVMTAEANLPSSIRGKLGGPSQRRLSSSTTASVLQAIISMKTVSSILSLCVKLKVDVMLNAAVTFLWNFFWRVISSPTCDSETGAEISLSAYEALAPVLKALIPSFSPLALKLVEEKSEVPQVEGKALLDHLVLAFLENINNLLAVGVLARSRRAVLMNWKWLCLESLLSVPGSALANGIDLEKGVFFFSGTAMSCIFCDLVESLENAGEGSVLSMLRSVRLVLGLFASGRLGLIVSSCDGVNSQMMWSLVHSSWILHVSCNKRRVAPIAALLSSVVHSSMFTDEGMHANDDEPGPLKWLVEKVIEEGTKSPRTIRLAALHLTGLWLSNPRTIKYYIKELKLLSMYGSVAFDEDFEAEIADNPDARTEVSLLARIPDAELMEVFINTELYARVSVSVLFYKLADYVELAGPIIDNDECCAALESGQLFLLELLDSAINDKDISKELYKKYSATHRRKVRAWQMLCILSRFVDKDIVQKVITSLEICLYRNNLPAVRQYLETLAIHLYLKFPLLVREQLVPKFHDYEIRPQALSSYVFIAANVILHATEKRVQSTHLDDLLPTIVPLLTSHHHSLRGFTQLLVYQVLCKLMPAFDSDAYGTISLEKKCFQNLKSYLANNPDCMRLRASMEGYLDAFDPKTSVSPAGIFSNRVEELEFECVPTSLMEQVLVFLNDVREDLRSSMAKDVVTIKNESLRMDENNDSNEGSVDVNGRRKLTHLTGDIALDFQKKITLSKHEKREDVSSSLLGNNEIYKSLTEIENEDQLLDQLLRSRTVAIEKIKAGRQNFILVASLLDRIPNLAGLARTCEVFKAAGLTIADASILHDKQFQLISVTAEKWVPIVEVPVNSVKVFLEKKKREGFSILGLEQTANSISLDQYEFPKKTVLVLGREKEGIPVDIIHILDACIEIPQLGVVRSLNVHVSGAIALWEYTRQQRFQ